MNKNIKRISVVCLCILLSGCSMFQSALNDIKVVLRQEKGLIK